MTAVICISILALTVCVFVLEKRLNGLVERCDRLQKELAEHIKVEAK